MSTATRCKILTKLGRQAGYLPLGSRWSECGDFLFNCIQCDSTGFKAEKLRKGQIPGPGNMLPCSNILGVESSSQYCTVGLLGRLAGEYSTQLCTRVSRKSSQ